ncbi:hypothetical protein AJ88_13610 [Mesorhizobium amorphae CCBAU 01583]|nr:hypothetical protein AJ88_13610 [Mesorhizobium amorphae CCBAU 01583]
MTTNIELDNFSGSWNEHSASSEHNAATAPAEMQVAQAATGEPAPAAADPVPVDVGSGAPCSRKCPRQRRQTHQRQTHLLRRQTRRQHLRRRTMWPTPATW